MGLENKVSINQANRSRVSGRFKNRIVVCHSLGKPFDRLRRTSGQV